MRKLRVDDVVHHALRKGMSNKAVVERVRRTHPNSRIDLNAVRVYRHKLRSAGEHVPTSDEAKHAAVNLIVQSLRNRMPNRTVHALVSNMHPDEGVTMATVKWHRHKLRSAGERVPTSTEASKEYRKILADSRTEAG